MNGMRQWLRWVPPVVGMVLLLVGDWLFPVLGAR